MKHILIYAPGGFYLGLGNVYRMMSLATALQQGNEAKVTFIGVYEKYVTILIKNNGFKVISTLDNLLHSVIEEQDLDVLIIDKLGLKEDFVRDIKKSIKKPIVIFGNNSSANKYADLVVNAITGTDHFKNKYHEKDGVAFMEGPQYLTLRDEFILNSHSYRGKLENILLAFGGTDQANFSCQVLKELLSQKIPYNFTLIIGSGYQNNSELKEIISTHEDSSIQILKNISNVSEILLINDFLITSPGTALFEAYYLGMPAIAFFQNDSQKEVFEGFFGTYNLLDVVDVNNLMVDVYSNNKSYIENLSQLEVGFGKADIIKRIEQIIL